ncbi:inositol monophosphatase family protein [Micromonospora sp. NPDC050187]|uniref:inositol monophosphatase family protein n=1 Tax=Micromonospora sp. NPDC050187 TaxID=3364277 RepID=UPI003799BD88
MPTYSSPVAAATDADGTTDHAADLALALTMADLADEITLRHFHAAPVASTKPDRSLVTEADLEVERSLSAFLAAHRPTDGIAAEETRPQTVIEGRCWAIDPVDHTNNFARDLPFYGTLIALLDQGRPVVGVVSAPALGRRWWASRGGGAFADGRRIRVSATTDLADAHISFARLDRWRDLGLLDELVRLVADTRWTFGSGGFLAQMAVAEGRLDLAVDATGDVWDLAAGQILVEEAGGRFTDVRGVPEPTHGTALVTNGHLHAVLLDRLAR